MKMSTRLSTVGKVDKVDEYYYSKTHKHLTINNLDKLFWLYDNDIVFRYSVAGTWNLDLIIEIDDDVDMMGYKLRWEE